MTEEDNGHFINSTKCWICDNTYVKDDVKVRDHCHITGKYRGSAHKDCNIKSQVKPQSPVVFHNRKNCNSRIITQELDELNFRLNAISVDWKNT